MSRRIYAKGPARAPRANFVYSEDVGQAVHVPDLTVFEQEPEWIDTGLVDADGDPIQYRTRPEPLGFFEFDEDGRPIT